jgi:hypothetical protein
VRHHRRRPERVVAASGRPARSPSGVIMCAPTRGPKSARTVDRSRSRKRSTGRQSPLARDVTEPAVGNGDRRWRRPLPGLGCDAQLSPGVIPGVRTRDRFSELRSPPSLPLGQGIGHGKEASAPASSCARDASSFATFRPEVTTSSACRWSKDCRVASFHCERDDARTRSRERTESCAAAACGWRECVTTTPHQEES